MNERVPLSFLLTQNADEDPPVEPTVPFAAMFGDDVKIVTAVLQRTAVLSEPSDRYDRKSVRHDQVLVDPAVITWRTRTSEYDGTRLLSNTKAGAVGAALMGRHRRPVRRPNAMTITPGNVPGAEARQASDERALQNQRDVAALKDRELAARRQQTQHRIEEEAMSVNEITAPPRTSSLNDRFLKKAKCSSCKQEKLFDEFPAPIHRGPNICTSCADSKSAKAATITQASATTAMEAPKRRLKKGRAAAAGKPRRGKKIALGETALLVSKGPHDKVVKLLERRDALRSQLADVQAQLAEAIG